jgi:hypothetical protein
MVDFRGDNPTFATLNLSEPNFGNYTQTFSQQQQYWKTSFYLTQQENDRADILSLNVTFQHIRAPHPGDTDLGEVFNFTYFLDAGTATGGYNTQISHQSPPLFLRHSGINHSDVYRGILTANVLNGDFRDQITDWNFSLSAQHTPEPMTMLGAATALGYGALFKRKYSEKKKS